MDADGSVDKRVSEGPDHFQSKPAFDWAVSDTIEVLSEARKIVDRFALVEDKPRNVTDTLHKRGTSSETKTFTEAFANENTTKKTVKGEGDTNAKIPAATISEAVEGEAKHGAMTPTSAI